MVRPFARVHPPRDPLWAGEGWFVLARWFVQRRWFVSLTGSSTQGGSSNRSGSSRLGGSSRHPDSGPRPRPRTRPPHQRHGHRPGQTNFPRTLARSSSYRLSCTVQAGACMFLEVVNTNRPRHGHSVLHSLRAVAGSFCVSVLIYSHTPCFTCLYRLD